MSWCSAQAPEAACRAQHPGVDPASHLQRSPNAVLAATMLWEALTPVSIFWGLALPLFVNWVCYDRLVMNPIMVGLMLMLPYKFIPGAEFCWL
jgi:hypothetical protein